MTRNKGRERYDRDSNNRIRLQTTSPMRTFINMYVVTEADAAAIREVYERDGELSAAICP
jgi:hypothetical protein